jgi:hypothetical protein
MDGDKFPAKRQPESNSLGRFFENAPDLAKRLENHRDVLFRDPYTGIGDVQNLRTVLIHTDRNRDFPVVRRELTRIRQQVKNHLPNQSLVRPQFRWPAPPKLVQAE